MTSANKTTLTLPLLKKRVVPQETVILRKILNLNKSKIIENYCNRNTNTRKVVECPCFPP